MQKMERTESVNIKASLVSKLVEWQFQPLGEPKVAFDSRTNLCLEEALEKKQSKVWIEIKEETYVADVMLRKAESVDGLKRVELHRKDLKSE